jgi:V/A-type H+-transporting ATPase subunit D
MAEEVKPTRSELIKLKRRIELTKKGHKLLKMKRDGLMLEFFKVLPAVKELQARLVRQFRKARNRTVIAEAAEGKITVKSAAFTQHEPPEIRVRGRNVMGVVVPEIEAHTVERPLNQRGYAIIGTSARIDEMVDEYEKLVKLIIQAAEVETAVKRLLEEIEKTKRRVNALEFKVIPESQKQAAYISMRLEEMERENIFRLKRIKAKE